MFKSLTYLRYGYDPKVSHKDLQYYYLVDSEFECEVASPSAPMAEVMFVATTTEYHKRNLPLIGNLYLLNNHILETVHHNHFSFQDFLDYELKYCNIQHELSLLGLNFSKDIYPKLLKMHKELSAFK